MIVAAYQKTTNNDELRSCLWLEGVERVLVQRTGVVYSPAFRRRNGILFRLKAGLQPEGVLFKHPLRDGLFVPRAAAALVFTGDLLRIRRKANP